MPQKLAKPCSAPGCPRLTIDRSGYCDIHRKQIQRQQDANRGSSTERGYDRRWGKARRFFLAAHPLCAICEREGRITPSSVVDHIIPAKGNDELFWDESNWQSLCEECHNRKTAQEDGGFGSR